MTSYLVYSTVALKWHRKIQCGNSCRRISRRLRLVWEQSSHQVRNQGRHRGAKQILQNFASPLEKYIGHSLKLLGIV